MRYLLLAYGDERRLEAMAAAERDELAGACLDNDEALGASGRLIAAAALAPGCSAAVVRAGPDAVAVGAPPAAATGERLRAVFIISARDLNEAISLAAAMPQVRGGPIEVYPLLPPARAPDQQ